jgi:ABC-type lipoprotein export system ATPase subunit
MALIELTQVRKRFGSLEVLKGIDFSVEEGEQLVIRGASGSGKSTLLYLLGGLDKVSDGKVVIGGRDLASLCDEDLALYRNRHVGFVFQFHFLLSSMSCLNNILLPARIGGAGEATHKQRAFVLAEELGVVDCLRKYPFELSGGEQQRVNIIRALLLRPKIFLCDEPTGNLDSQNSTKVVSLITKLCKDEGATLIMVTHNDEVAKKFGRTETICDGIIQS